MRTQFVYISAVCSLLLFLLSCENNLKDVERVAAKPSTIPVDKSTGVELIFSEGATVKAKLLTPELLYFHTAKPYYEMKKGLTIIFLDLKQQESSRVVADYGMRKDFDKTIELRRNVVVTSHDGKTFKSEELIWDENARRFYSTKMVAIQTATQLIYGTRFWANEDFSYYEIDQSTGNFDIGKQQGF
ncbi:MAG: LPS export ABC transporter periplasmic protein LptC [Sphingobacteriaceae bacterium]|nr:LPS export ABC transporter periplasmic protein LptC [Sphingobacteriaceae bacterium]